MKLLKLKSVFNHFYPIQFTNTATKTYDVVFIGAGKMVGAIVQGLIKNGTYAPSQLACTSAADGTGEKLKAETGIDYHTSIKDLFPEKDNLSMNPIVFLGCKPQQLNQMDDSLKELTKNKLIISILAGSTIKALSNCFPDSRNIVRSMPNIPGSVNHGMTGYASKFPLNSEEKTGTENILGGFGKVLSMQEEEINACTGVSGSGPAYVFEFIAALRDGGIKKGLSKELAEQLAIETVVGASLMVKELGVSPDKLTPLVTSKGGTTFAGLEILKKYDIYKIMADTVAAAANRADELGKMGEKQ